MSITNDVQMQVSDLTPQNGPKSGVNCYRSLGPRARVTPARDTPARVGPRVTREAHPGRGEIEAHRARLGVHW